MNLFGHSKALGTASDEELLSRYRRENDLVVLAELFKRYRSMVYYVSYKYLQDGERSKDAVMQVFEELIVKVNKQEIREFGKWLYVLTRNHCLMQLRAGKKMQLVPIDEGIEFRDNSHQGIHEHEKNLSELETCMEKLPLPQRKSIDLFFLKEKCYKEVAALTGFSLSEVKSYIQNGKRNLRICMEKHREY